MGIKFNKIAMKLITDLGLNYTFFIQAALFLLSYFFLSSLFEAYYKAYLKRCSLVEGQDQENQEIQKKVIKLKEQYGEKLKNLNQEIQVIFSTEKQAVDQKIQILVGEAQSKSENILLESQTNISNQLKKEKKKLFTAKQELSQIIIKQILN